jgi:hypothetical protein
MSRYSHGYIFIRPGAVYEMLTGKSGFDGPSPASLIAANRTTRASGHRCCPRGAGRALKTCLARGPDDRWQSARDLTRELERIASAPGDKEPVPPRRRIPPWAVAAVFAAALGLRTIMLSRVPSSGRLVAHSEKVSVFTVRNPAPSRTQAPRQPRRSGGSVGPLQQQTPTHRLRG